MNKYQVTVSQNGKLVQIVIRAGGLSEMIKKTLIWCDENNFIMPTQYQSELPYFSTEKHTESAWMNNYENKVSEAIEKFLNS